MVGGATEKVEPRNGKNRNSLPVPRRTARIRTRGITISGKDSQEELLDWYKKARDDGECGMHRVAGDKKVCSG